MLHGIIGNQYISNRFLRFETDSGAALDPVITITGAPTFQWISPDGSISTGSTPNPVLDQTGCYTLKCSDWSKVDELKWYGDNIISVDNLGLLTALNKLLVYTNGLTELDVSGVIALTELWCFGNSLAALDVVNLSSLIKLICYDNSITALDVAALVNLTHLHCYNNPIPSLEVAALVNLVDFKCRNCGMTEANVDNILAGLVTAGANNGTVTIDGTNAAPSAAGLADKAILVAAPRNWAVTTT